jgi:hypothetical protein
MRTTAVDIDGGSSPSRAMGLETEVLADAIRITAPSGVRKMT